MEEKTVNPMTVFFHMEDTTLRKIAEVADREIPKMMEEAEKMGLEQIAPMNFRYLNCTDDMDKEFTLEIAMVVREKKDYKGKYRFKEWGSLKCVSSIYKGDINKISGEYERLFKELYQNGKQHNHEIREVYTQYIDMESPENITEIQIGLN